MIPLCSLAMISLWNMLRPNVKTEQVLPSHMVPNRYISA
jgi:hypothetical protein